MTDYTHFQRGSALMQAAMVGPVPSVPVYAQVHEYAAAQLKIPGKVFYTRPDILVPALLQVQSELGLDVASLTYDVYNIEAEGLGQRIIFSDANLPDIDRQQPLINDPADLVRIKTPPFASVGRFAQIIEMQMLFKKLTGLEPTLSFCAPFTLAANLYGIERLLVAIYQNPMWVRAFFDCLTDQVLAPWICYQRNFFPQATNIVGADATASLPIVNLKILREWVAPSILRLRELCGPAVQVANWVGERFLKNPLDMLDLKLMVGRGSLQGQDPDVASLTPDFYKTYAVRKQVPLVLGIGAAFLAQSQPAEVARRVQAYIQVGRSNGRFALYLCNLGATTPPANVHAAIQAAHTLNPDLEHSG